MDRFSIATAAGTALAIGCTVPAAHAAEGLPDRFALKAGGYFVKDAQTSASAGPSGGGPGTEIEFDRDLNGETDITAPRVEGYFRFTPHHRLDFGWYTMEREGETDLGEVINFGDRTFSPGAVLESRIETTIRKLTYTWSFHHNDKLELGVSLGVHYPEFAMRLKSAVGTVSEEESFDAPLPVWGLLLDYSLTERWHVLAKGEIFRVKLDGEFAGSLTDLQLQTEYRLARNFAVGAGLSRLRLKGDVDNGDFQGDLEDIYRGYQLYGAVYF